MKFGQLIERNQRNIFFSKVMQKMRTETNSGGFHLLFRKTLYEVKAKGLQLSFKILKSDY